MYPKILKTMRDQDISFFQFAIAKSLEHQGFFNEPNLSSEENRMFANEAKNSIHCQEALEAADAKSFADFLDQYFS